MSYWISAGRSIQILANTREMVINTLRVMSMGIWVQVDIEGCRLGLRRWTATCSVPAPRSSAICTMLRSSASVLRHSAPIAPRLLTFTFGSTCLARRADSLHNLLLTKLHSSITYVHSFKILHSDCAPHLVIPMSTWGY